MFKRILPRTFIAVMVVVCGVLWLVSGLGTGLDFTFNAFWPSMLIVIGVAFLIGTFCYRSLGYLYFFVFFVSFGGLFLYSYYMPDKFGSLSYLWPLLIACPGLSSLVMFFARKCTTYVHLKMAILFLLVSAALFIANYGILSWSIIAPAVVVVIGLTLLASFVFRRSTSWDLMADTDEEISEDNETTEDKVNEKSDIDD